MPTYEVSFIFRKLPRPQQIEAIKRSMDHIYDTGGYIRKMESLGERILPQRTKVHQAWHTEGAYFLIHADMTIRSLPTIRDEWNRDLNVLRSNIFGIKERVAPVCTLEEELLPPAERPSVQDMISTGRRPPRWREFFRPMTGLDYYPFHR